MVSYSDIVTSLAELSADDNGLSNINTIVENFETSNSLLTKLDTNVKENCKKLRERGEANIQSLNEKLIAHKTSVIGLEKENAGLTLELVNDEDAVKKEVQKVIAAKADIESARKEALAKEKEIIETVNVLKRLKNIAIDELQGLQQKTTEMHKFNVTVTTSFVQMPSFQEDLKGLLSKADSVNRGLISTLILLSQSAGKQTYANPETVKKIVDMIEKIISNSLAKMQQNFNARDEKIKSYNGIVDNSRDLIARLKEEIQRKVHTKANNEREIVFYKNDIIFFQRAVDRRVKRNTFSNQLCSQETALVAKHYNRYTEALNKVTQLREQLADH